MLVVGDWTTRRKTEGIVKTGVRFGKAAVGLGHPADVGDEEFERIPYFQGEVT